MQRTTGRHLTARPPLAFPGETVGLLGGSFNPPHSGHRLISDIAQARLGLARMWWLVTPGNPLKNAADLATDRERVAAAVDLAGSSHVVVTDFEAALGSHYTVATLTYLRTRYPGVRFVWVMGADSLASMHRWRRWRRIFEQVPIVVVDRPGWHWAALASPAARAFARHRVPEQRALTVVRSSAPVWTYITGPRDPISSTAIRARARAQADSAGSGLPGGKRRGS